MNERERILLTEYCNRFDELRKDRMCVSHYKYGSLKSNSTNNFVNIIESLRMRLEMYEDTGNTEFLCDIANFAMIEFMYPQHPKAHFEVLDDGKSHIVGMSEAEMKRFKEEAEY